MDIHRIKYNNLKYLTHSRVHYLWAINELNERKRFARATDVASLLGVTRSAVSIALAQLKSLQLVEEILPERFLQLTPQGKKKLNDVDSNFITLSRFFQSVLKLDEETATKQACLIEHLLLEEVAEKMNQLIDTKFKAEKTPVLRERAYD